MRTLSKAKHTQRMPGFTYLNGTLAQGEAKTLVTAHPAKTIVPDDLEDTTREGVGLLIIDDGIEESVEDISQSSVHGRLHRCKVEDAYDVDVILVLVSTVRSRASSLRWNPKSFSSSLMSLFRSG